MLPTDIHAAVDIAQAGSRMYELVRTLFPICRSATGEGNRQTLRLLGDLIPLTVHEVPSGTSVFDWTIPKEWRISGAHIKSPDGATIVDFRNSNLHVVGHSVPVRETIPLVRLQAHLHSLPDHPDWIPYRTSFYQDNWGFCLADRVRRSLMEGDYEVVIDSELIDGSLTYGECFLPGESSDEVLISAHICHPSLANDNLSGIVVAASLAQLLLDQPRRYSYRFVFAPGTLGAITWLARNEDRVPRIRHGLIATCLGDPGTFTYKRSRRGNADVDRAVVAALKDAAVEFSVDEFSPYGYDERQYCSPGFNLPVGSLTRTTYGRYPEYHTSADDLTVVRPEALGESLKMYARVMGILESNRYFTSANPKCEPQLSRRGLYRAIGHEKGGRGTELARLWVLNLADGRHSLLDMVERSGLTTSELQKAISELRGTGLLREQECE